MLGENVAMVTVVAWLHTWYSIDQNYDMQLMVWRRHSMLRHGSMHMSDLKKLCRHGSFIWLQYSGEENTYTGPRRLPALKYKGEKMWTLSVHDFVPLKGVKCRCGHKTHSQMTSSVISQQNYDICGFPGITGCVMTSSVRVLLLWFSQKYVVKLQSEGFLWQNNYFWRTAGHINITILVDADGNRR